MSNIPEDVNTFLSLDKNGNKIDFYDQKLNTMFTNKNYLENIVSVVYHELFNAYGPVPWNVKEYLTDSIKVCSRDKIWNKQISLNLLYGRDSFVIKYLDNTDYFKNEKNNKEYTSKYKRDNLFNKSDIISIDNTNGAIYFGIKTNNELFKYKHKPLDREV